MAAMDMKPEWASILDAEGLKETGGAHNNEGVDYARYWAMIRLFELEKGKQPNYVLLFEYLQDVAEFDCPRNPKKAYLYQLKKKEGGFWSKAKLCELESSQQPDEAPSSIDSTPAQDAASKAKQELYGRSPIGKLYVCVEHLSALADTEGIFLSNAPLKNVKTASGASIEMHTRVLTTEMHTDDYDYFQKKLRKELKKEDLTFFSNLSFEQSTLQPASMRDTVRGRAADYLEDRWPDAQNVSGRLVQHLFERFSSRSGVSSGLKSLQDVVDHKGFTKSDFQKIVNGLVATRTFPSILEAVIHSLKLENYGTRNADKLSDAAVRLRTQMVSNPAVKDELLWDDAVKAVTAADPSDSYLPTVSTVSVALKQKAIALGRKLLLSEIDTNAIAILAIIYVDQQPTTAGP